VRPLIVPSEIAADLVAGGAREWLETNGLGSFAMGTVAGPATRRYHAILCAATRPPVGRMVLVNRCDEELLLDGIRHPLASCFYPGVVHPEGHRALVQFRLDPWPTWTWRIGGALLEKTLFMPHRKQMTVVSWRLVEGPRARLFVRPMITGRDYHALHHENPVLKRDVIIDEGRVTLAPYDGVPVVHLHHSGVYAHRPEWYRHVQYPVERERGLPFDEDLFSPGELAFELSEGALAVAVFGLAPDAPDVTALRVAERERRARLTAELDDELGARLTTAAEQFVVERAGERTLIAGYPWFTDWGRDTFVSLPALVAVGWVSLARELLLAFAPWVRGGLIPNRFPDDGEEPEYNSVDAPLWFVLAACRLARAGDRELVVEKLLPAMRAVIDGYLAGTRFGIGVDDDGLIHAAAPGLQLTWMDAKVGDWVVTPREGKPVEIQALWVAALEATARLVADDDRLYAHELGERAAWARSSFAATFWSEKHGHLYDVVDGARKDATLRPNQLYALGLCAPLVDSERAERVLVACERELVTRIGLRSRARGDGYRGRYLGDQRARDGAYHEGTVWPYLLGIYADACRRVRGRVPTGLLDGVRAHLAGDGMGTLHEIFDGDPPHAPRGCPAQAWSVCEALRIALGEVGVDA
jgi:predicted glycogen debranching enzyme